MKQSLHHQYRLKVGFALRGNQTLFLPYGAAP